MNLSAPWRTYASEVSAFFSYDNEVKVGDLVELGNANYRLDIRVTDAAKAYALQKIIRSQNEFGNIIVYTNVELEGVEAADDIMRAAFRGHTAVADVATKALPGGGKTFVRFLPEIVQFYNDNTADYNGNFTSLIHDVAKNIFECVNACIVDLRVNEE